MNFDEYKDQVFSDALDALTENFFYWYDSDSDEIYDGLWTDDSVTGNGSGSYYFNSYQANEAVKDIIFDECERDYVLGELGFAYDNESLGELIGRGSEAIDVIIRCAALEQVFDKVIDVFEDMRDECADSEGRVIDSHDKVAMQDGKSGVVFELSATKCDEGGYHLMKVFDDVNDEIYWVRPCDVTLDREEDEEDC